MTTSPSTPNRALPEDPGFLFRTLHVERLDSSQLRARAQALLAEYHYLGGLKAVGEQVHYAVSDAQGAWVAVLIFAAAALHLRPREQWIGWSDEQRRRRLALVANNVRFLLLPERTVPNLGSVVLSRVLERLSDDWQAIYGHPVLLVETFVDPERFQVTVYQASGWTELGRTKATAVSRAITIRITPNPNACLPAYWSPAPAAPCRQSTSNPHWPRSRRR